jgi:UDPglucose 6-dehydrogenase
MKVGVIGVGYVGLVTGVCLSELGHDVFCVDCNRAKIEKLRKGAVPIYEPGLDKILKKNIKEKRIKFGMDTARMVKFADIIFICVHTPPKPSGEADLRYVEAAAREIASTMKTYKVIVDKSTVPVRTGEKVAETIKRYNKKKLDFDVVSNPEFLREGSAIEDFFHPDRVVIGVTSKRSAKLMRELYAGIKAPTIITNIKSAEIIKHASNSFLAMKISFVNAVANICELSGAHIEEVTKGMGLDSRIGEQFLNAGVGYGGSCFPKDVSAFIRISEALGYDFELLKAVEKINSNQKQLFLKKIEETLWVLGDKVIGVLGLAFKPNTDDMRNAPSVDIIRALQKEGAKIKAYDPKAAQVAKPLLPGVKFCKNPYEVARESDALLIMTEWDEFKELNLKKIRGSMRQPIIIDGRNIFDPDRMDNEGYIYKSIGR